MHVLRPKRLCAQESDHRRIDAAGNADDRGADTAATDHLIAQKVHQPTFCERWVERESVDLTYVCVEDRELRAHRFCLGLAAGRRAVSSSNIVVSSARLDSKSPSAGSAARATCTSCSEMDVRTIAAPSKGASTRRSPNGPMRRDAPVNPLPPSKPTRPA